MYFALSTLPILRTFVETENNHSSHQTVTSSGEFSRPQSHSGPEQGHLSNLSSSAVYAATLVAENPSLVWCSPLVANQKLNQRRLSTKYTPPNHGLVPEKTFVTHNCEKHDDISAFSSLEFCPVCYFCLLQFYRTDPQLHFADTIATSCLAASELRVSNALLSQLQFASCQTVCRIQIAQN